MNAAGRMKIMVQHNSATVEARNTSTDVLRAIPAMDGGHELE